MAEPILDATTERVYAGLPQHYKDQDANYNWQLKRYLSGLVSSQNDVNTLVDRLTYVPPEDGGSSTSTSDLVNPYTADQNWLEWLGQLFGTSITGAITDDTRNEVIEASGFHAGNTQSITAAAQSVLVGTKKVRIIKHADTSWQPDMNGKPELITNTNFIPVPYYDNLVSPAWSSAQSSGTFGTGDIYNGALSARQTQSTAGALTFLRINQTWNAPTTHFPAGAAIPIPAGTDCWFSADVYLSAGMPVGTVSLIGRDDPNNDSAAINFISCSNPNSPTTTSVNSVTQGVWTRLWWRFTVKDSRNLTRLYISSGSGTIPVGEYIQTTRWMINPVRDGETQPTAFFDGNNSVSGSYNYRWIGTTNQSMSQEYIPAVAPVENTATQWDMLIMTLQSETLKNLLPPELSESLTPSAWIDNYNSFGYDPTLVRKQLVDQPGVYQNRAYSFTLSDPTWQASAELNAGFGYGPFGQTTFGYSNAVTSDLQIISRSAIDVTPGDSYQFIVSLGLEQDQIDQKISTIGFQFLDASNNVIKNAEQTNYFPDPSMEHGVVPFDGSLTVGTGTIAQSTIQVHSGSHSVAITNTATGAIYQTATSADLPTPNDMNLNVGDLITASAWVYVPSTVTGYTTLFALAGSAFASTSTITTDSVPRNKWVQIHTTNTVSNTTGTITPRIYGGTATNDVIYFDDFGVAAGTNIIDFSGDTTPPLDGSVEYAWLGTAGSSYSVMNTDFFDTQINIVPTIENTAVVSHNLIKSSKDQYYAAAGEEPNAVDITNFGKYDNGDVIRATINNKATTSDFGITATDFYGMQSIPSGTTFIFSLDYYGDVNANIDALIPVFNDDNNNDDTAVDFDITTPAFTTLTKGRWHTKYWRCTVKPDRTVTSASVIVQSSVDQSQGAYLDTANWKIEEGTTYNPYFNGDTPANDLYTYQWDGIPNASITNKVLTSVAEQNVTQMQQFNTRFLAPTGAASAKVFVRMLGFNGKDTLYIAQPAVREEIDETWIARTADPVQAVIDKGVKPAGIILHWLPIVSSWDAITDNGTRTWDELSLDWTDLEELGT